MYIHLLCVNISFKKVLDLCDNVADIFIFEQSICLVVVSHSFLYVFDHLYSAGDLSVSNINIHSETSTSISSDKLSFTLSCELIQSDQST